jgi:hypothetical protein
LVQRAADDTHVVLVLEVADQGGLGAQMFQVLAEVLPAAAPALVVLEHLEEALGHEVGSRDQPHASAGTFG